MYYIFSLIVPDKKYFLATRFFYVNEDVKKIKHCTKIVLSLCLSFKMRLFYS